MSVRLNSMIRCENCGRLIPSGSSSCPYCGYEIANVAESNDVGTDGQSKSKKRKKTAWIVALSILALFTIISVLNSIDFSSSKTTQTQTVSQQMNTVQNNALGQALNNDSNAKVVYNPRVSNAPNKMLVSISRVILADDYTAIECAVDNTHGAYSYIAIDSETWITPNESHIVEEQLTRTDGIAISPGKTAIPKGKVTPFTLYFPPIDKGTDVLDLEESGKTGWKFYGIQLK